jgi:hypothetical protein
MAYLGKTPSQAVRSRYYFTASGGETSLSGTDDNGNTLTFTDGNYVDVSLNGATLVAGTDYNTTTANTIGGLVALTASDVVEVVVYDTFSVFSGNVNSNFSVGGNLTVTGTSAFGNNVDVTGTVTADGLTVDGDASAQSLGIGTNSPISAFDTVGKSMFGDSVTTYTNIISGNSQFQPTMRIARNVTDSAITIERFNNAAGGPFFHFGKGRSTTIGDFSTIVQNNDILGQIVFSGADGDQFRNAATIRAEVDGTPGNDDMPGRIVFATTSDGSQSVSERMRIDSSGNVGIGTSSPSTLMHLSSTSPRITLTDTNTGADHRINADSGAGNLAFDIDVNSETASPSAVFNIKGSERMRILSSGGITFNGDTSSANALNDYEEGTWTPTAEDESGNTGTTTESTGYYRKIGGLVHVELRMNNINTTGLTSTNDFVIGGLPFTHSARTGSVFAVSGDVYHAHINTDFTGNIIAMLGENQDFIKFVEMTDSGGDHDISVADLTSGSADILMSFTYHTEQ